MSSVDVSPPIEIYDSRNLKAMSKSVKKRRSGKARACRKRQAFSRPRERAQKACPIQPHHLVLCLNHSTHLLRYSGRSAVCYIARMQVSALFCIFGKSSAYRSVRRAGGKVPPFRQSPRVRVSPRWSWNIELEPRKIGLEVKSAKMSVSVLFIVLERPVSVGVMLR